MLTVLAFALVVFGFVVAAATLRMTFAIKQVNDTNEANLRTLYAVEI